MARRPAYSILLGLICAFVVSSVLGAGAPAQADPGGGPRAPKPAIAARPKVAPQATLRPQGVTIGDPRLRLRGSTKTQSPPGCGGAARFGQIYRCASPTGSRRDVFTLTTPVASDILYGTVTANGPNGSNPWVYATVYDAGGSTVCGFSTPFVKSCPLTVAGTYTAVVTLQSTAATAGYTFSVQSVKAAAPCSTLDNGFFSFASAGHSGYLPEGAAGDCYTFDQPVGSLLKLWPTFDVRGEIYDANYRPVCTIGADDECTLTTAGPYHLLEYDIYGAATGYALRMARLSRSEGCPVLRPAAFGDPGSDVNTGAFDQEYAIACHKLLAPAAGGVGIAMYNDRVHADQEFWWTVYDDAGRQVCDRNDGAWVCMLPAAGDYTIITTNLSLNPVVYRIAVAALYQSAGCTAGASLGWDQDAAVVHQTVPLQTDCQEFHGTAGQRVITFAAPAEDHQLDRMLVDSIGRTFCRDDENEDGCVLPSDGTYRMITRISNWSPASPDATYKVQVRSLSSPTGCPVVTPGAYNAPPAGAAGPIRCRTVRITQPGDYRIIADTMLNDRRYASVYDRAGHRVCRDSANCTLPAAGDYSMVLGAMDGSLIDNDSVYVTAVLPRQPAGCPELTQELFKATFTDPGQYLCVRLPQSAGQRVNEFYPTDLPVATTSIVDSTGAAGCASGSGLRGSGCALTGTAPFFAVVAELEDRDIAPGPFAARFRTVGTPASCPALDGTPVATGGDSFLACRTIPADAHGARVVFSWPRASGAGGAHFWAFDANGAWVCGPYSTFNYVCDLPAGPVTVMLEAGVADATYEISYVPYPS